MIKKAWKRYDRHILIGLAGITLSFLAGTVLFMSTIPWLGLSDTSLHLDYSWQVSKGQLPDFYEGAEAPLPVDQPPVHFVSQHPPLYHLIISPFVGNLIDQGHWQKAAAAASIVTIFIGLICVYVFSWAGWVYGKTRRKEFAIAVPAVLASLTPFIIVSSMIFNDVLALLFSSIGLILVAIIIRNGINVRYALMLSAVALLGMASRASFISVLIIILAAIPLAVFLNSKNGIKYKLKLSVLYNLLVLGVIGLGIGWFYKRNIQLSGNWTQSAPGDWPATILGRHYKTLEEVIASKNFLLLIPTGLYGPPSIGKALIFPHIASIVVFMFSIFTATYQAFKNKVLGQLDRRDKVIYSLLLLHVGLIIGQQITHAVGYGGLSMRYLLPIWIPLGLTIAYAGLSIKKARGMAILLIVAAGWLFLYETILYFIQSRWAQLAQHQKGVDLMQYFASEVNGLPSAIVPFCLLAIVLGIIMQGYALWKLSPKSQSI